MGFLSSCDGDLREPLGLPQETQASFLVLRGNSGFLLSQNRRSGLISRCGGEHGVLLELQSGP